MPSSDRPTITELFRKYGCDKGDQPSESWMWAGGMNYGPTYDMLFAPLRDKPITFLELGWGEWDPEIESHENPDRGGRSAKVWREYFTNATIVVIDIAEKVNTVPGVDLFQGSQDDPEFLASLHARYGDFDVVIDDASHISSLTIASFDILWPMLTPGGIYVVEDLHTSYHDWFYPDEANANPELPCHNGQPTAMQYMKMMADEANFRGIRMIEDPAYSNEWDCYPRQYWRGHSIDRVMFQYNLAVVTKANTTYA